MDEILLPTICVDIDSLHDGSYRGSNGVMSNSADNSCKELALVVRLDKEICPVLSADSSSAGSVPRPLDLQQVDFLGSVDAVKKLFSMPYTDERPLFAVHKMGNTLLLDSMTGHDTNPYDINFSNNSSGGSSQGQANHSYIGKKSTHTLGSHEVRNQPLQFADSAYNSLDQLITSSNMESLLGKVTPLYLQTSSKSDESRGLITNEESDPSTTASNREVRLGSLSSDNGTMTQQEAEQSQLGDPVTTNHLTDSQLPCTSTTTGSQCAVGSSLLCSDDFRLPSSPVPVTRPDSHGLDEYKREQYVPTSSPFLPNPNYFMPPVPPPARQVLSWDLHEMRLALSSDITIYRTEQHPAFTVKTVDTSKEFELSTCLDFYLDNVMANVPEFALALQTKGFVRSIKLVRTSEIPHMKLQDYTSSDLSFPVPSPHNSPSSRQADSSSSSGGGGGSGGGGEITGDSSSRSRAVNSMSSSSSSGDGEALEEQQPMFDPKVIDMNASTILRFLKANCRQDDGTYILRQSTDGEALHLYDLGLASSSKQKHFKWMLAMLSYRFAIRLGHHIKIATVRCRVQIRQRQMHLFTSCYQLLREIKDMGGEDHGTIRVSVLEQMADAHLARVDDFTIQGNKEGRAPGNSKQGSMGRTNEEDDEEFDQHSELQEAVLLLCRAVECLGDLISKEMAAVKERDAAQKTAGGGGGGRAKTVGTPLQGDAPSLNEDEASDEGDDDDDDDDDGEGMSGRGGIVETLAFQLAGVLHKLVQASLFMVMNCIRSAKISECLDCLSRLVTPCNLWSQLKSVIMSTLVKSTRTKTKHLSREGPNETSDSEGEILRGADMTIVQSLPILWDLTGETCREIAKQTAGISLEDTDIKQRLETLVFSWSNLSRSVLGGLDDGADCVTPSAGGAQATCSDVNSSSPTAASNTLNVVKQAETPPTSKKAKVRAKAKAKMRDLEPHEGHPAPCDLRESLRRSATSKDWVMLSRSLTPSNATGGMNTEGHPYTGSGSGGGCGKKSQGDEKKSKGSNGSMEALQCIHCIVAPLVLHDTEHLERLQQLNCYNKASGSRAEGKTEDPSPSSSSSSSICYVLTPAVVRALSAEKGSQDEFYVNLLMTYCFLCAAIFHHLKAIGGIEGCSTDHHTGLDGSSSSVRKGKKIKGQRAHKAGAEGPVGLKVSDPNVRLCLRRLGDSCNSISQRLMKHASLCQSAKDGLESEGPSTQDPRGGGAEGQDGCMREECLSLAHRLFSSSLVIFEAVGDICNAAMIRCNLSSLLRSQATWEMDTHSTHATHTHSPSSKKIVDVNTSYEAYRACFARSLLYLNEAQGHCDLAVVLFQGGGSSSGREDSSEQNKSSIPIPKGNIRNAVALETALTCLNLGVLRKTEIFRCHVHGTQGCRLEDKQEASFAEKEKAIVQSLEIALELFYELRNFRQAAAAHYQLGSFYSSYWPLCPARSDALLEKALLHYREAHSYYSKYDVGPTLLLILIDMCDLYLAAYSATEPYLTSSVKDRASNENTAVEKVVVNSGTSSRASSGVGIQVADMDGISTQTPMPSSAPSESESELVVALLGGALQSLLESRFAFTPAVAERSKYRSQIIALAVDIARRLGCVLMKVLKAHSKGYVPCALHAKHSSSEQHTAPRANNQEQEPGPLIPAAAERTVTSDSDGATLLSPCVSPLLEAGESLEATDGEKKAESGKKCSKAVLEAKSICVELLKWSISKPSSVKAEDIESAEGVTAAAAVTAGAGSHLAEPSSPSVLSGAAEAAGAGAGPPAAISVARLFELIDMVNQNEWLRSCANSNK